MQQIGFLNTKKTFSLFKLKKNIGRSCVRRSTNPSRQDHGLWDFSDKVKKIRVAITRAVCPNLFKWAHDSRVEIKDFVTTI